MSSTARGAQRQEFDYYATPVADIVTFLLAWLSDGDLGSAAPSTILDPCAGGNTKEINWVYRPATASKLEKVMVVPPSGMSYPEALRKVWGPGPAIITNDIRPDSPADYHVNFLTEPPATLPRDFDIVITNPPFSAAQLFIQRAMEVVRPGGYVVMLLRLNFLETQERFEFFSRHPPKRIYVHHQRMSFTPDGGQDSVAYAHFVWQKDGPTRDTLLRVI